MNQHIKNSRTLALNGLLLAGAIASINSASAAYVFTGANTIINEDFNGLPTADQTSFLPSTANSQVAVTGTGFDAVKLSGSGSSATSLVADAGSSTTGTIHSYGATGASERALGSLASGSTIPAFGFELKNSSSTAIITDVFVSFTQENWRSSTTTQNVLTAGYGTSDSGLVSSSYLSAASGISAAPNLNLTGPAPVVSPNGALDGNNSLNQVSRSLSITGLSINPGESLFLRWQDVNETGFDAGLAIDELELQLTTTGPGVPEPTTYAGIFGGLLLGFGFWRRSTQKS